MCLCLYVSCRNHARTSAATSVDLDRVDVTQCARERAQDPSVDLDQVDVTQCARERAQDHSTCLVLRVTMGVRQLCPS